LPIDNNHKIQETMKTEDTLQKYYLRGLYITEISYQHFRTPDTTNTSTMSDNLKCIYFLNVLFLLSQCFWQIRRLSAAMHLSTRDRHQTHPFWEAQGGFLPLPTLKKQHFSDTTTGLFFYFPPCDILLPQT